MSSEACARLLWFLFVFPTPLVPESRERRGERWGVFFFVVRKLFFGSSQEVFVLCKLCRPARGDM